MPSIPSSVPDRHQILRKLFFSPNESRLRAGWRLTIQTILLLLIIAVLSIPVSLFSAIFSHTISDQLFLLFSELISFLAVTISVFLSRRLLDRRSFPSLGLERSTKSLSDLAIGFVISFLCLSLVYFLEVSFGWIQFESFAWETQSAVTLIRGFLIALMIFILVGWNEELLSRGYHLQTLSSGSNLTVGVIVSSAIFGILHLANPNANWISAIGIFLAGLFLAFGYLRTRKLWLSIGLHIGWNFTEGVLLGFSVSGWNGFQLIKTTTLGPEVWTGGAFGPEAGLIILPALTLGAILIYIYTLPIFRKNTLSKIGTSST